MKDRRRSRDEAKEIIESFIIKNNLAPHTKLPSERDMCEKWNFNRTTLRFAVRRLIIEGKLYQKKGAGTYVSQPKLVRNLQETKALSEVAKEKGYVLVDQVLSLDTIAGYKHISKKLHLNLGDKVYVLTRLRSMDGEPVALEIAFLDYQRFKGLDQYDFSKDSLYSVIEKHYNVTILHGEENIGVTYATNSEAELLNVEENLAMFYVSGVAYDDQDLPVEYFKSIIRSDKMEFASVLRQKKG